MLRGDSSYIVDTRGETRRNIRPKTTKKRFFFLEVASYWRVCIGGEEGEGGRSSIAVIQSTQKGGEGGFGTCCCYTAPRV